MARKLFRAARRYAAALGGARRARAHRHQVRLRRGAMRRLYRARQRPVGACLRDAGVGGRGQESHHHRGPLAGGRPSAAESVGRGAGAAVRLLPVGPDHAGRGAAREEQEADTRANRHSYERQSLPLRHVQPHRPRHPARRARRCSHDDLELLEFKVSRRAFLGGSAGLAFAFTLGLAASSAEAQPRPARLNAYVSIAPDGTITIQSPVAEMGQGIMTGLPLIVAEELDADWSKVKVEQSPIDAAYHHPIFKAQYVVASISTLGYWTPLRIAGAQARRVLVDAAAEKWGVPAAELTTEPSTVVHAAQRPQDELRRDRRVRRGAGHAAGDRPRQGPQDRRASTGSSARACPRRRAGEDQRQREVRHRRARAGHGVRHVRARAGARQRPGLVQRRRGEEAGRHRRRGDARPRRRPWSARPSPR